MRRSFSHDGHEPAQDRNANAHAKQSADQREQKVLGKKLRKDIASRGSEGGSNGDLSLAGGSFGQQEIGDIDAGDQEHEAHCSEENPERSDSLFRKEVILQRLNIDAPTLVALWKPFCDVGSDGLHAVWCKGCAG